VLWIRIGFNADPDPGSQINADSCGSGSVLKRKNEEISHLRISFTLEGQRLLLESERPLGGFHKKFSALLKHFVLTEYFSSVFVLNKPCSGSGPDNDFIKVWISDSVKSFDPDPVSVIWINCQSYE
jgi:hypothetical protein